MLVNFTCFFSCLQINSKLTFINFLGNNIRVSNSLDTDKVRHMRLLGPIHKKQKLPLAKKDNRWEREKDRERGESKIDKMGLDARKPVFGGWRTTQAQTSLRIRAV